MSKSTRGTPTVTYEASLLLQTSPSSADSPSPSNWLESQVHRCRQFDHPRGLRRWASQARKNALSRATNRTHQTTDAERYLPGLASNLLSHLDVDSAVDSLQSSMALTDAVLEDFYRRRLEPLDLVARISALAERELWELPESDGCFDTNVALSRRLGSYFTPPAIAWYIVTRTLGPALDAALESGGSESVEAAAELKVVDPCCGAGIFLGAALELFLSFWDQVERTRGTTPHPLGSRSAFTKHVVVNQLVGVELSPRFADLASHGLRRLADLPGDLPLNIRVGNALTGPPPGLLGHPGVDNSANSIHWDKFLSGRLADFVLLNPPYGRLRSLAADYLQDSRALRLNHSQAQVLAKQHAAELESFKAYIRSGTEYMPALGGVPDWQRLFLVRSISLLRPGGRLGAIVPTAIAADRSARRFREFLLGSTRLERLDRLPESAALFETVNQPTCILVTQKGEKTQVVATTTPTPDLPPAPDKEFSISFDSIQTFSPDDFAIPCVNPEDWTILEILSEFPRVADLDHIVNRRGELDLSVHKAFLGRGQDRLIRGDHIERFLCRHDSLGSKEASVPRNAFLEAISGSSKTDHVFRSRVVGRQCAYLEKPRRLSFSIVPAGHVVANSCNYLLWDEEDEQGGLHFLCGLLNSALHEWRFRLTSSNNHVNNYEIDALPVPSNRMDAIARRARRLAEAYEGMDPVDGAGTPPQTCANLEALLDAEVFTAFGLNKEQARMIMQDIAPPQVDAVLDCMGASNG